MMWNVESRLKLLQPFLDLLFQICHIVFGLWPECRHMEYNIGKYYTFTFIIKFLNSKGVRGRNNNNSASKNWKQNSRKSNEAIRVESEKSEDCLTMLGHT